MSANSGGCSPPAEQRNSSFSFSTPVNSAVYVPSVSCLIGISHSLGCIEVLDIHSGCCLMRKCYRPEGDQVSSEGKLHCTFLDDEERLFLADGRIVGCRGILDGKILLDTILECEKEDSLSTKIELDIVQAEILLKGLCKWQNEVTRVIVSGSLTFADNLKVVVQELQKVYQEAIAKIKGLPSKAVKWITMTLEMEKAPLSDVFISLHSLMSPGSNDPTLPIVGDIVRRLSLHLLPTKTSSIGQTDKLMMLGEVERLKSFRTWPHQSYEYAHPAAMAEAGFYHPGNSPASEDKAVCFCCDMCLVYWEPSDQPWSEHERHSSSCPFVKGQMTSNVPLSVCAAVSPALSFTDSGDKIVSIGTQSYKGMVCTGSKKGRITLWKTYPSFEIVSKIDLGSASGSQNLNSNIFSSTTNERLETDIGDDKCHERSDSPAPNSQGSLDEEVDQNTDEEFTVLGPEELPDLVALLDDDIPPPPTVLQDSTPRAVSESDPITDGSDSMSPLAENFEIQSVTLAQPLHETTNNKTNKNDNTCHIVVGIKRRLTNQNTLSIFILDQSGMEEEQKSNNNHKTNLLNSNEIQNNFIPASFDGLDVFDTGEFSVIDEYLKASENAEVKVASAKEEETTGRAMKDSLIQKINLPCFIDPECCRISKLFATKSRLIVIVKNIAADTRVTSEGALSDTPEISKGALPNTPATSKRTSEGAQPANDVVNNVSSDIMCAEIADVFCSSKENDTSSRNTQQEGTKTDSRSFILVYKWIRTKDGKVMLSETFYHSREFHTGESLNDVILISSRNSLYESRLSDSSVGELEDGNDVLVAAIGTLHNELLVMSGRDLSNLRVIPVDCHPCDYGVVENILYCSGINALACCFRNGKVFLCFLDSGPNSGEKMEDSLTVAAEALSGDLTQDRVRQLMELTRFMPINHGIHLTTPVNWNASSTLPPLNMQPQSKRRLQPNLLDIHPIGISNTLLNDAKKADSYTQTSQTRSEDNIARFKIHVNSETSIGYIDLTVRCNCEVSRGNDISVKLYLISMDCFNEDTDGNDDASLLCGPLLLSDAFIGDSLAANLILSCPRLFSMKSCYFLLEFEYIHRSVLETKEENRDIDVNRNTVKSIADFISKISVGVFQFTHQSLGNGSLPESCRMYLLQSTELHEKILSKLINPELHQNTVTEDSEEINCLELLIWIWNVGSYEEKASRLIFASVIENHLKSLVEACFVRGGRTIAHRAFQLIVSIKTFSSSNGDGSFERQLVDALTNAINLVSCVSSVGAMRWLFRLTNEVITSTFAEALIRSLYTLLNTISSLYGNRMPDNQNILHSRFNLNGSPFETFIAEPLTIDMCIGDSQALTAEEIKESSHVNYKYFSIPGRDIPGILETQPICFESISTSKGSSVEKVNLQSGSKHAVVEDESTEPVIGNNSQASMTHHPPHYHPTISQSMLVVERMHATAQHFTVIDFKHHVSLTDILIPPCTALASMSLYSWKENQNECEARHIATTTDIGLKSLVVSDMIPAIKCRFIKIIATAKHKLVSSRVAIGLGIFYGKSTHLDSTTDESRHDVYLQYNDILCMYALASARLSREISNCNFNGAGSVEKYNKVITKAYSDCTRLQLELNHRFHSITVCGDASTIKCRDLKKENFSLLPNDFLRVLIECIIEAMLIALSGNIENIIPVLSTSEDDEVNLAAVVALFKQLCVHGPNALRLQCSIFLHCICETQAWWGRFVCSSFRYCFANDFLVTESKERLLSQFMETYKVMSDSGDLIQIFMSLMGEALSITQTANNDSKMIDWLLIVIDELLPNRNGNSWMFLTPSADSDVPPPKQLESQTREEMKSYLKNTHAKLKDLASASKKKYPLYKQKTLGKHLENLPYYWRHAPQPSPSSAGESDARLPSSSQHQMKDEKKIENANFQIEKNHVLPAIRNLLRFVQRLTDESNFARLLLTCKVASRMGDISKTPIHISEIATTEDLMQTLSIGINSSGQQQSWIQLAIVNLLHSFLPIKIRLIPCSTEDNPESVNEATASDEDDYYTVKCESSEESSGDSSSGPSRQEEDIIDHQLADIASSMVSDVINVVKQSKEEKKTTPDLISYPAKSRYFFNPSMYSTWHCVEGYDRSLQIKSNDGHVKIRDNFTKLLENGLQRTVNKQAKTNARNNSTEDFSLNGDISTAFEMVIDSFDDQRDIPTVLRFWLAMRGAPEDHTNSNVNLPPKLIDDVLRSDNFTHENVYHDFIAKEAISNIMSNHSSASLLRSVASAHLRVSSKQNASHHLSLLRLITDSAPGGSLAGSAGLEDRQFTDASSAMESETRVFIKKLLMEMLAAKRSIENEDVHSALQLTLQPPVFITNEDELDMTLHVGAQLSSALLTFYSQNKELMLIAKHKRAVKQCIFVVEKGQCWMSGSKTLATKDKYWKTSFACLDNIISAICAENSPQKAVPPVLCLLSNLLRILTMSKDATMQSELVARNENKDAVDNGTTHPLVTKTYSALKSISESSIYRRSIIELIIDQYEQTCDKNAVQKPLSEPLKRLLCEVLISDEDVDVFLSKGGLALVLESINATADSGKGHTNDTDTAPIDHVLSPTEKTENGKEEGKLDYDGSKLQNFAPRCKIEGPIDSPPADILLRTKTLHRRSRFATWSYQLPAKTDGWISFTIELPFTVLLKQIDLHPHPSFLGNCPSEIVLELQDCGGSYVPHSPKLCTPGLSVIHVYFAGGVVTKGIKLQMRRPLDSEIIKLNIIEIYGSTVFPIEKNSLRLECNSRLNWICLFRHMIENSRAVFHHIIEDLPKAKLLFKSLVSFIGPWYSENLLVMKEISCIISIILTSAVAVWRPLLKEFIELIIGQLDVSRSCPDSHRHDVCLLFSGVTDGLSVEQKSECLLLLMPGILTLVQGIDTCPCPVAGPAFPCLRFIGRLLAHHPSLQDTVDKSTIENFNRNLVELVVKISPKNAAFKELSNLLSYTTVKDYEMLDSLAGKCIEAVDCDVQDINLSQLGSIFSIVSHVARNDENSHFLVKSQLPSKLCHFVKTFIDSYSSELSVERIRACISTSTLVVTFFDASCRSSVFRAFMASSSCCDFLKTLIVFLSSFNFNKRGTRISDETPISGRTPLSGGECEIVLSEVYALQSQTINLIKRITLLNEENAAIVADVLKEVIYQRNSSESRIENNSFFKCLILQIIFEETAPSILLCEKNHIYSPQFKYNPETCCIPSSLQLSTIRHVRLSDTLGIVHRELDDSSSSQPKDYPPETKQRTDDYMEDEFLETNVTMMVEAANVVTVKRQTKDSYNIQQPENSNTNEFHLRIFSPQLDEHLPKDLTIGQLLRLLRADPFNHATDFLYLQVEQMPQNSENRTEANMELLHSAAKPSFLQVFAAKDGIQLLTSRKILLSGELGKTLSTSAKFLLKFISLSGFSDVFLKKGKRAEYFLRLMVGVEETSEGDLISSTKTALDLPLLPFITLEELFKSASTDFPSDSSLRRDAFDKDIITSLLDRLEELCLQNTSTKTTQEKKVSSRKLDLGQKYWAKGTGFGTGATISSWNAEKAIIEKKKEEDHIISIFQILGSYINPCDPILKPNEFQLPVGLSACLEESCLQSVLSNYLRNDSVLDMARHIPLFNALMKIVRALASCPSLIPLLTVKSASVESLRASSGSISQLLVKLNLCADTYVKSLKRGRGGKITRSNNVDAGQGRTDNKEASSESLNLLIRDIQETASLVNSEIKKFEDRHQKDCESDNNETSRLKASATGFHLEEQYLNEMKTYQFDTFEFMSGDADGNIAFSVPFHYASAVQNAIAAGDFSFENRSRRLAQEISSLTNSLPLSFSSSVFVRCDESRLDLMKVLITGPEDTPYANGCFEFDVYFPPAYPSSPLLVNLQTTGQQTVRFNPNLYNDGKVCLSILNTWHGRPEEKWNPRTSNLLQVVVSIQSLIFVTDPYFNEPGYERSRGTPVGEQKSHDYNANIKQATVKWAMLQQIRNPPACFQKVIHRHFVMKKTQIIKQCETWLSQMKERSNKKKSSSACYEAMKKISFLLKQELDKLSKTYESELSENGIFL